MKTLIVMESVGLLIFYAAWRFTASDMSAVLTGRTDTSFFASVLLFGFVLSIVSFPFTPLFSSLSRRHEYEADRFSRELTGDAEAMITSLVKLSKDNLSNLHPHPLYAFWYYSHPPVADRIKALRGG